MDDDDYHVPRAVRRVMPWPGLGARLLYLQSANERRKFGKYIDEIIELAQPGDIILFQGDGVSMIQQVAFGTRWSHVAIVYRDHDGVMCFAQADRHLPPADRLHDEPTLEYAISAVPLDIGIRAYLDSGDGGVNVVLRRLILPNDDDATRNAINAAIEAEIEYSAECAFEMHLDTYVATAYPWLALLLAAPYYLCGTGDDDESPAHDHNRRAIYCSQFVSRCLARAGIFRESVLVEEAHALHSNIAPAHFDYWNEPPLHRHQVVSRKKRRRHALPFVEPAPLGDGRWQNVGLGRPHYVR